MPIRPTSLVFVMDREQATAVRDHLTGALNMPGAEVFFLYNALGHEDEPFNELPAPELVIVGQIVIIGVEGDFEHYIESLEESGADIISKPYDPEEN